MDEDTGGANWRLTWIEKSKLTLNDELRRLGQTDGDLTACDTVVA